LNRIIRESLERSEKNIDWIQGLIPSSYRDLTISKKFTTTESNFVQDQNFLENIPLVMSTQASITPRHQSSSHIN